MKINLAASFIVLVIGFAVGYKFAPDKNIADTQVAQKCEVKPVVENYNCSIPSASPANESAASDNAVNPIHPSSGSEDKKTGNSDSRFMRIAAERLIDDISRFTDLTEEQRNSIIENGAKIAREYWEPEKSSETLKQILGAELYQRYNNELGIERAKFQQQVVEKEVLFYGRKLQLNENQENELRSAFVEAQAAASELGHSSQGDPSSWREKRQTVKKTILEKMQGQISAEQLRLLQKEMEDSERFWGRF